MTVARRTLAKGAAWMAPAISIAAAAPSLAASDSPAAPKVAGSADKCPGLSDVPERFPKHGCRVVLTVSPSPQFVVPVSVLQNNGKYAQIVSDAVYNGQGWEFICDATSSPSKLTVTVSIDGHMVTLGIKTRPHCN